MSRICSLSLAMLVLCVGCSDNDGTDQIIGSGILTSESRNVTGFTGVVLAAVFGTVNVQQGLTESVMIQAEENIIPAILTTVVDGVLVIDFIADVQVIPTLSIVIDVVLLDVDVLGVSGRGVVGALDPLTAGGNVSLFVSSIGGGISLADLTAAGDVELEIGGIGDIVLDTLTADTLTVTIDGLGGVEVSGGSVTQQTIHVTGTVIYDTVDMASETASIDFSGDGQILLQFSDMLTGEISGGGTVLYQGDPALVDVDVIDGSLDQLTP